MLPNYFFDLDPAKGIRMRDGIYDTTVLIYSKVFKSTVNSEILGVVYFRKTNAKFHENKTLMKS